MAHTNGRALTANLVGAAPTPPARPAPTGFVRRLAGSLNRLLRIVATDEESAAFTRVDRELDEIDRLLRAASG